MVQTNIMQGYLFHHGKMQESPSESNICPIAEDSEPSGDTEPSGAAPRAQSSPHPALEPSGDAEPSGEAVSGTCLPPESGTIDASCLGFAFPLGLAFALVLATASGQSSGRWRSVGGATKDKSVAPG